MRNKIDEWLLNCHDEELLKELNCLSENDFIEHFHDDLKFGTGGLRAEMGVGTNCMNIYTVRKATQGIANVINRKTGKHSVVIGYDTRNYSKEFAWNVAKVFKANNFEVNIFDNYRPTPMVSFAVRELNCDLGVMITASHNPKEYNGYKVYGNDGGQITLQLAKLFQEEIIKVNPFFDVKFINTIENINILDDNFDSKYINKILELPIFQNSLELTENIVYSPIHGASFNIIKKAFEKRGFNTVNYVKEQIEPNGDFPTVKSPNPEEKDALNLSIELAKVTNSKLVLATDPDGDRLGVAIIENGKETILSGNQLGALFVYFILNQEEGISSKKAIVTTIVSSDLGKNIAKSFGVTVFETLTGFKYIGEKIEEFENSKQFEFLFGYEESFGYLMGTFVRDKDATIAALLVIDMFNYFKYKGLTLIKVLEEIYQKFGRYHDELKTYTLKGDHGLKKINTVVNSFRNINYLKTHFNSIKCVEDYSSSIRVFNNDEIERITLEKSNVIKVIFEDDSWFAVRPSGTEPKLKIYINYCHKEIFYNQLQKVIDELL